MKSRICYPYLLECCNYTSDVYWKSIFTNLSCGIPPHGVYIHKDFLVCNYKDKNFSYKLLGKTPEELFTDIHRLFKTTLQLVSRDDILKKQDEIDNLNKKIVYNNWTDIKRKNTKDILIENFVLETKTKYNLTFNHARTLLNIINIGLTFKYISYKDIIMEHGSISAISNIVFPSSQPFSVKCDIFTPTDVVKSTPSIFFKMDTSITKDWEKYLAYYKKIYSR